MDQSEDNWNVCFLCYNNVRSVTDNDHHPPSRVNNNKHSLRSSLGGNFKASRTTEKFCQFLNLPSVPYETLLKDERLIYCSGCIEQLREITTTWMKLELLQAKILDLRNCVEKNLMRGYQHEAQQEEQSTDCADTVIDHPNDRMTLSSETRKKIIHALNLIPESSNIIAITEPEFLSEIAHTLQEGNCPPISQELLKPKKEELDKTCFAGPVNITVKQEVPEMIVESVFQNYVAQASEPAPVPSENFSLDHHEDMEDEDLQDPLWSPAASDMSCSDLELDTNSPFENFYKDDKQPKEFTSEMNEIAREEILTGKKQLQILVERMCWDFAKEPNKVWIVPKKLKKPIIRKRKKNIIKMQVKIPNMSQKKPRKSRSASSSAKIFPCPDAECCWRFESEFKRDAHLRRAHQGDRKPYKCELCGKEYGSPLYLERHKTSHTGERPYICDQCGKTFRSDKYLDRHSKAVHQLGNIRNVGSQCPICSRFLLTKGQLVIHLRTHTGERPFLCEICTKYFRRKIDLRNHQKLLHSTELQLSQDDITCKICLQKFNSPSYARQHEKCHDSGADVLIFACNQCSFRAPSKVRLQTHLISHSSEQTFLCTFDGCRRGFRYKNSRDVHVRKHLNDRRHKCTQCSKAFTQSSYLKNHIAAVHEPNSEELCAKNKCQVCGEGFPLRKYLLRHLDKHKNGKLSDQPSVPTSSNMAMN